MSVYAGGGQCKTLACAGVYGDESVLNKLVVLAKARKPDCILFAGGILAPSSAGPEKAEFLARFLNSLGQSSPFSVVIPGAQDAPLREFARAATNAELASPQLFSAHAVPVVKKDVAVVGLGGTITEQEDSHEPVIKYSRATAEYFLRTLLRVDASIKIMMLSEAAPETGGTYSEELITELIHTYRPFMCVVGSEAGQRGAEMLPHTLKVNTGTLARGSAAWIRRAERQVEMIEL